VSALKITLWIPSNGNPRWPCVNSWLDAQKMYGENLEVKYTGPGNVHVIWNDFIKEFLKSDSDWLMSCHHDVVFAPGSIERLLSWDEPLVSALIFMRQAPPVPHIWNAYDGKEEIMVQRINDTREWFYARPEWIKFGPFVIDPRPDDALTPVDFTSTSFTLIRRDVLEEMRPYVADMWFEMDNEIRGGGEDRRFCQNARMAGFTMKVDRSCVVGHLVGDIPTSVADFIAWDSASVFNNTGEQ